MAHVKWIKIGQIWQDAHIIQGGPGGAACLFGFSQIYRASTASEMRMDAKAEAEVAAVMAVWGEDESDEE